MGRVLDVLEKLIGQGQLIDLVRYAFAEVVIDQPARGRTYDRKNLHGNFPRLVLGANHSRIA